MATIAENLQTILNIKSDIKNAIIAKGVSVADSDGFGTYASKIQSIETGTATTIDVAADGIKFYTAKRITEIPSYYNFDNVTNMSNMFYECNSLTSVPQINSTTITIMLSTFYNCYNITTIPLIDTSKVTNMENMFYGCSKLTTVPALNTSKCETFRNMFCSCNQITTIPEMDWSGYKGSYGGSEVFGVSYNYAKNIENIGGFKDAGKSYTSSNNNNAYKDIIICYNPKLTYQSCMNVINKVYDMNLNTQNTYTPKIRFHKTPYALLSAEDIAIATSKGWSVVNA